MSPAVDDDIRAALRAATRHLTPSPELLTQARTGGRRRLHRRRAVLACALVGALALTGGSLVLANRDQDDRAIPTTGRGAALLARPTAGDLADDPAYLAKVVTAWNASHATSENARLGYFKDLRGKPHVVWAGTTPTGRAALLLQRTVIPPSEALMGWEPGPDVLVGVLEERAGQLRVIDEGREHNHFPLAFVTGPERDTVIAIDSGERLEYSLGRNYHADGRVDRTWRPMERWNGAFRTTLDDGTSPAEFGIRPIGVTQSGGNIVLDVQLTDAERNLERHRQLPWPNAVLAFGSTAGWPAKVEDAQAPMPLESLLTERLNDMVSSGTWSSPWAGYGTAPDGTRFMLAERTHGSTDASRVYALLLTPAGEQIVDGGPIDPKAALPITMRLPGGRGIAIAQYQASLRWRTGTGPWSSPATSAALAPDSTTQVEVTRPGRAPEIVTLPR